MRASRKVRSGKAGIRGKYRKVDAVHISGAEGIYESSELVRIAGEYISRAMHHSRGKPDEITVTVERLEERPLRIRSLPVATLQCRLTAEAERLIRQILQSGSVSRAAVSTAFRLLRSGNAMRGGSLVMADTGRRVEPDRKRGIRVSRHGITRSADRSLSQKLSAKGIDSQRVKEAVILASKVSSCRPVIAELCISDDPDYTTGYVATRRFGYLRIPGIKKRGSSSGGRVFFMDRDGDIDSAIAYLEKKPVMVTTVSACRGECSIDEIIG